MSSEDFDRPRNSTSSDDQEPKEMEDKSSNAGERIRTSTPHAGWGQELRQRPQAANAQAANSANEKLLDTDLEMVQLDRVRR